MIGKPDRLIFLLQTKLAVLEQRLLKEEYERQLVQKKADRVSLHFYIPKLISNKYTYWHKSKKSKLYLNYTNGF